MSKVIGVICAFMCTFSIAEIWFNALSSEKFVNYNLQHPENKRSYSRLYVRIWCAGGI